MYRCDKSHLHATQRNPTQNLLHFTTTIQALTLHDTMGKKVFVSDQNTPPNTPINLPNLPPGVYIYTINTVQNTTQRGKIIIAK